MNKKLNILSIFLLSSMLFSCNQGTQENPSYIKDFINNASKSYTVLAKEKEIVNKEDGSNLYTNDYNYSILSVSGSNARIKEDITYTQNGTTQVTSISYVKDKDGYVATEVLNYKNEITTKYVYDSNNYKQVYDNEYRNPFSLITSSDLSSVESNKYRLKDNKTSMFGYYLLGIDYPLSDVYFNFKDEKLENILFETKEYEGISEDANTGKYIKIKYKYSTEIYIYEEGNTKINSIETQKSRNKEKETILKNALSELTGNYTITMNEHDRDESPNHDYDGIWYFDGSSKVYHRQSANSEVRNYDLYYKIDKTMADDDKLRLFDFNEDTLTWDYYKPINSRSYNVDPKTYDYFVLKCLDIAPELFKYDEENNKFVCDNKYVLGYMGNYLLPGCYALTYFTYGEGDKAEIFLNSNNKIKKISVGYTYTDSQGYEIPRDVDMTFANIGTTVLPDYIEA